MQCAEKKKKIIQFISRRVKFCGRLMLPIKISCARILQRRKKRENTKTESDWNRHYCPHLLYSFATFNWHSTERNILFQCFDSLSLYQRICQWLVFDDGLQCACICKIETKLSEYKCKSSEANFENIDDSSAWPQSFQHLSTNWMNLKLIEQNRFDEKKSSECASVWQIFPSAK